MASANKSPKQGDDRTGYSTDSAYPDVNTPLNVTKSAGEPGPEVWNEIPTDTAENNPDPMGYLRGLEGGKGKKR